MVSGMAETVYRYGQLKSLVTDDLLIGSYIFPHKQELPSV